MFNDRKLPKDITIKNMGNEPVSFRYYGVNLVETLNPGDEIVISGASSETTGFYLAQMNDAKGLTVTATDSDKPQPEPGVTHTVRIQFRDNDTGEVLFCNPTLDDAEGIADAEGGYTWENVEEGIHTLRVDYVEYEVFQDDINVLNDYETSYSLMPKGAVDTYNVRLAFLDENNNPVMCNDVTLDGVRGSIDENLNYNWYDIEEGMHNVYATCAGYQEANFDIQVTYDFSSVYNLVPEEPISTQYELRLGFFDEMGDVMEPDNFALFPSESTDIAIYTINDFTRNGDYYVITIDEGTYYLRANCTNYMDIINVRVPVDEDFTAETTFYTLEPGTYEVQFRDIDDSGSLINYQSSAVTNQIIDDGGYVERPPENPQKEGYVFKGFYYNLNWAEPEYIDLNDTFDFENTPIHEKRQIDVVWTYEIPESYELTAKFTASDTKEDLLVNPTLDGVQGELDDNNYYHWFNIPSGSHSMYVADNAVEGYYGYNTNWMISSDDSLEVELQAMNPEELEVSIYCIDAEGTDLDNQYIYVSKGSLIHSEEVNVDVPGYTASGYYADRECTQEFDFSAFIMENTSVYVLYDADEVSNYNLTISIQDENNNPFIGFFDEVGTVTIQNTETGIEYASGTASASLLSSYEVQFVDIPVGTYSVIVQYPNYEDLITEISHNSENTYSFSLQPIEEPPEELVTVTFHGIDEEGNDLWDGSTTSMTLDAGDTVSNNQTREELESNLNLNFDVAGRNIYNFYLDTDFTQEFDFNSPIMENTDVYVYYKEPETYTISARVFNSNTGANLACDPTLDGVTGDLDEDDIYYWRNMEPGEYQFVVDYEGTSGHYSDTRTIQVVDDDVFVEVGLAPEGVVTVLFEGVNENGDNMWNGTNTPRTYPANTVLNKDELEDDLFNEDSQYIISGYHVAGYFTDTECTQVFNFSEPIVTDMSVYILYKPDVNSHILKIGFNVEDDGVETYTTVDNITISDEEGEEIGTAQYDDNTHQYVFSNISNGNYDLVAEKSGYARIDTNILLTRSQEQEVVLEYTLGTTTSFNVEFYDNDVGADESLNVDSISFVDANGNAVDFDMIATEYTTVNDTTGYVYSPRFPVEIGEYTMTVTKYGYTTRTETVNINGWFSMLVPLENDSTAE